VSTLDRLGLAADEVHVWWATLDRDVPAAARLERELSTEERSRRARLRRVEDRTAYTMARGMLRTILARYLGLAPSGVPLMYGPHGKPQLAVGNTRLQFNLSHSHGVVLIGLTHDRPIGVDVERVRQDLAFREIARRFFAVEEQVGLAACSGRQQAQAFFRYWTCKEAFLKASGIGLARPLDSFAVDCISAEAPRLLRDNDDPGAPDAWALLVIEPLAGYIGALATRGRVTRLTAYTWPAGCGPASGAAPILPTPYVQCA
jgi:4'-phosphopantetheinyl transferase